MSARARLVDELREASATSVQHALAFQRNFESLTETGASAEQAADAWRALLQCHDDDDDGGRDGETLDDAADDDDGEGRGE